MSRLLNTLKYHKIKAPVWVGKLLSHIPFEIRPGVGKIYRLKKNEIRKYASLKASEKNIKYSYPFFLSLNMLLIIYLFIMIFISINTKLI